MKKYVVIVQTSSALAIPMIFIAVGAVLIFGGGLRHALTAVIAAYAVVALPLAWIAVGVIEMLNKAEQEEDDQLRGHLD